MDWHFLILLGTIVDLDETFFFRCLSEQQEKPGKAAEEVKEKAEIIDCKKSEADVISGVMANVLRWAEFLSYLLDYKLLLTEGLKCCLMLWQMRESMLCETLFRL